MPTELDSLQLNITAKTSDAIDSIKKLMTQLEFLGQRIGVFNTLVESSGKVENLSKSIDLMNKSVTEFNVPQLEQMAKAMKSFARSAQKIGTVKGFGTMSESALRSNEAIHKLAVGFASTLGVEGKESIEAVESELSKFFDLIRTNKDPDFTPFVTSMKEIAIQAEATKNQTLDSFKQFQEVRRWLSTSNIYLPEKFASEFGKDYSHVRGVIGIRNTTSDMVKGTQLHAIMQEMNRELGTTFKLGKTDVNLFHQLYDYMIDNNGKAEDLARNFYSGSENASKLNNIIHGVIDDMYSLERASEALKENVSTVDSSPIQQITDGLSALGGINVDNAANIKLVADAVAKIGSGKNIEAASASLPKVAQGLKDFAGIQLPNWTNIAEFTSALRGLGSKSVSVASQSLNPLAEGLRKFQGLTIPNVAEIRDLASAIAIFGRKTSQEAVNVIPKLATEMNGLFITLSKSPTVSRSVIDLTNALGTFLANLKGVSPQSQKASNGFKLLGNSAKSSSKKMFSLASAIGKIYATYFLLFRFIGKLKQAIDISSSLKEVQNVVNTTFGEMTDQVEEFATSAVENFGMSELSAKKYASRFQAMAVAMGIPAKQVEKAQKQLNAINPTMAERGYNDLADSMADMSINVTKLAGDMASFYNVEQADVAKDLEAIYTGMTRPLRQYGLDLTEATLREWAMKNGLDADIKSMTQAEKTLLRYQYVMANTSAVQGDFAKTSVTWANQIRMLKQNFERLGAVIGSGFIAWLRPMVVAVNNAMDSIISAVQNVVNALGKIFGWEMIVDTTGKSLIEDTEEVAEAWDDATGAAKKYAKQLLGIDEINNLTTNDGGSGSGDDGAGGGISGGNLIDPGGIEFKKFESEIDNLYDLGKKLSEAFANLLPDDWSEIYKKASNFGRGLADFLNGLIQPDTFKKLGKTIAGGIMTAIVSLASFSDRADWEQYGEALGEGINGFFEEFDGAKFALGLNKFASGVLKAIRKALETVDWGKVWEDIVGFISNLSPDTITLILGTIMIKKVAKWVFGGAALNALKTALISSIQGQLGGTITLSSLKVSIPKINIGLLPGTASGDVLWDWFYTSVLTPFHEMLPSGLRSFLENTFAGAVGGGLAGSVIPGLGTLAGTIVGALVGAFTSEPVEPLREAIFGLITKAFRLDNAFETWDASLYWFDKIQEDFAKGDWASIGEDILMGIMGALLAPFEIIASPFINLWEWVWNGIRDIFGIHSPAETMQPIGENIVLGILDGFGLVDFMDKITTWWDENVSPWFTFDKWAGLGQGIYDGLTTKWNDFTSYFELDDIWSFITDTFSLDTWLGYGSDILDGLSTKWNEFTSFFKLDDIWSFIQDKFSLDSWTFSSISDGLSSSFNAAWDAVKQGWNGFADWLETHMTFKLDKNNPIGQGLSQLFGGASEVKLISLPRFEYGGFPDQGSLFVAGETYGQSEWVGNINGKTGVTSGYEITGIANAIYDTSAREMELLRQQNEYLMGILNKEFGISRDAVGEASRSYARDYYKRTGNQAYSF